MNLEHVKKLIKSLNWAKLAEYFCEDPMEVNDVENLLEAVYLSDAMVRRRPDDNGARRSKFLTSLADHLRSFDFLTGAETIGEMKIKFEEIDIGYVAIFETESQLPTNEWTSEQRISAMLTMLQRAAREVQADILRSMKAAPALTTEPAIYNAQGERYNPNAVTHNLSAAAFNILMMESYREGYFNSEDQIVLPARPPMSDSEAEPIVGNYTTAHLWKVWKTVDEKTRFLGGDLKVFYGRPSWIDPELKELDEITTSLEFAANFDAEVFTVLAGERFDERQKQTYFKLITDANLIKYIASKSTGQVALPPEAFLSPEEGHAAIGLHHALSVDIQKTLVPDTELTVSELLRGFSALQILSMEHMSKTTDSFMKLTSADLGAMLESRGLSSTAIANFLSIATLNRSSKNLYDCPLIRDSDENFLLFGWTIATADLLKLVLSSISSREGDIDDKGALFEQRMIKMFRDLKFDAKNIRISRGQNNEFDYDVAFTWGDYAFFFECKNRSLPTDSPIAVHYFNHTVQSHLKQVPRLRKGLDDYPDVLSALTDAVGKKRVFAYLMRFPMRDLLKTESIFLMKA